MGDRTKAETIALLADVERAMLTGTGELSAYAIAKRVGVKFETAKSMMEQVEKSWAQRDPRPLETIRRQIIRGVEQVERQAFAMAENTPDDDRKREALDLALRAQQAQKARFSGVDSVRRELALAAESELARLRAEDDETVRALTWAQAELNRELAASGQKPRPIRVVKPKSDEELLAAAGATGDSADDPLVLLRTDDDVVAAALSSLDTNIERIADFPGGEVLADLPGPGPGFPSTYVR